MAKYIIKDSTMLNIGDAIREQTGNTDPLSPAQMVDEIGTYLGNIKGLVGRTLTDIKHDGVDYVAPYAFYSYSTLNTVEFPNCTSVGMSAFVSCTGLTSVSFPLCASASTSAFTGCTNIQNVTIGFSSMTSAIFPFKVASANIQEIHLPQCTTIAAKAFAKYSSSKYYSAYSNLTYVSAPVCSTLGDSAFRYCKALKTVYFPECTSVSATTFSSCRSITNATIGIESLDDAAYNPFKAASASLAEVYLPKCMAVQDNVFSGYSALRNADLPKCTLIAHSVFQNCTSLASVNLPVCQEIHDNAFAGCTSLASVNLPVCQEIHDNAFAGCTSLASVNLPVCQEIHDNAFRSCSSLTQITLPSLKYFGALGGNIINTATAVFRDCTNLSEVNLPICETLGSSTFYGCNNLMKLTLGYSSRVDLFDQDTFANTPMLDSSYTGSFGSIYVPASLVDAYKVADNWSAYADRITAIEE